MEWLKKDAAITHETRFVALIREVVQSATTALDLYYAGNYREALQNLSVAEQNVKNAEIAIEHVAGGNK